LANAEERQDNGLGDELERFSFWLRYPPRGRRPKGDSTVRAYLYTARRFRVLLQGAEPDQAVAEAFVRQLEEPGNSPRSIGRHIHALRAYFAFKGLPLDLGAPAFQKRLPRWLTDEEWAHLLQAAERPLWDRNLPERARVKALFHRVALMVYGGAGLRLSEGCALRREHVDPSGYIRVLGKGGEEDIVPVEDSMVRAIQEWLAVHESPWVFPGRGDGHLHPRTMQSAVRDLMLAAGLQDVRRAVHSLRHTVGADLRKRGADIRDIQDVLRHADIGTTQIYTHMAREELRKKLPRRFMEHNQTADAVVPNTEGQPKNRGGG
jgi:integrase/recombinase XerD